ncbi:ankyrin repeat domain-containing protein [Legionella dresdenensis]|uniref:Ankyrin repeat domain-containing protein n=1 Tax=Legionella dresdenensis TaxID=450200 RepID=A0ABV8CD23_9GAMM
MVNNNSKEINYFIQHVKSNPASLNEIKSLAESGIDINLQQFDDGNTALILSAINSNLELAEYLLTIGANPLLTNHDGKVACDYALNNKELYQLIINYELLFSAKTNDLPSLEKALGKGAEINFQDNQGYSALMYAASGSHLNIVEFLIEENADLTLENNDGVEALHLARGHLIYQTIFAEEKLTDEDKRLLLGDDDEYENAYQQLIKFRKSHPFSLEQLDFSPYVHKDKPKIAEEDITELEYHFGHPIPKYLKDIWINYNGCRPKWSYFFDENNNVLTLSHFYFVGIVKNGDRNIWDTINNFADELAAETLPFAEDDHGSIYYLKWHNNRPEVWLFEYGEMVLDDCDDDEDITPIRHSYIKSDFNLLLESLYDVK